MKLRKRLLSLLNQMKPLFSDSSKVELQSPILTLQKKYLMLLVEKHRAMMTF